MIGFHDSNDCGDRYDDVNGHFWEVCGMRELTPAGKKIKDKVYQAGWVVFG